MAERRNAYVHYKWRPFTDSSKPEANIPKDVEAMVRYLSRYENRVVFGGMKRKVLPPVPALAKMVEKSFVYIVPRLLK